jgi:superoxide dismutase, Fe-Mn family
MSFTLPDLGYAFDALEPYIDAKTMEIHHDKHHAAYVAKLNDAIAAVPEWQDKPIEEILKYVESLPSDIRPAVRNNGGGHYNHTLFWETMKPGGSKDIPEAVTKTFGSTGDFKTKFADAAVGQFGSGWAWLVKNGDSLEIMSTANQETPLKDGKTPVLGLDVWEHAYYLKYQNKRPDYIAAWWNVVNWDVIAQRLNT